MVFACNGPLPLDQCLSAGESQSEREEEARRSSYSGILRGQPVDPADAKTSIEAPSFWNPVWNGGRYSSSIFVHGHPAYRFEPPKNDFHCDKSQDRCVLPSAHCCAIEGMTLLLAGGREAVRASVPAGDPVRGSDVRSCFTTN
jgi:hypothetical protein